MKIALLAFLFILPGLCFGQDLFDEGFGQTYLQNQMQQGRLVTVSLTLGNPLKIFVTGKEEARFNLSNLKLKIRRLDPYPSEELVFDKTGRYYTVRIPQNGKSLNVLEITATVKDESESFQFKLNNKKP